MSVISIFSIPQVVELTTAVTGAPLMNYPVNRTDFNLARYVDNEIVFFVKNIDRRPVSITGNVLTMNISDFQTGKVLLTRDLTVTDAAKGQVQLFVSGDESAALPRGALRYSIIMLRTDGVQIALYTDRDRKGVGVVNVIDGPLPDPIEPVPLGLDDFISRSGKLYSTALPGAAAVHNVSGQHSAVLHLNDFSGNVTVQGTLEPQPSSLDGDWFVVKSIDYTSATSVEHVPFEGNLMNVRFVVTVIDGTIDLILYRN